MKYVLLLLLLLLLQLLLLLIKWILSGKFIIGTSYYCVQLTEFSILFFSSMKASLFLSVSAVSNSLFIFIEKLTTWVSMGEEKWQETWNVTGVKFKQLPLIGKDRKTKHIDGKRKRGKAILVLSFKYSLNAFTHLH